jgi:hypothetical protein
LAYSKKDAAAMKGAILAGLTSCLLVVTMTVSFRTRSDHPRAVDALRIYFVAVFVLLALYVLTPRDLGFLAPGLSAGSVWLDFTVGEFALAASFFGGWLQLYNLANRGYSLRMLVDMAHLPQRSSSPSEIIKVYSDGRGLYWMYDLRIQGILDTGMIVAEGSTFRLTPRGEKAARIFRLLRKVYRVGQYS